MRALLGIYAFLIGLCFGSFALATAWRLKKKKRLAGTQRSQCEHCRHQLAAKDLLPLVSWLSLRGRCRYCGHRLSPILPLAELTGGIFFASSYLWWPERFAGAPAVLGYAAWNIGLILLLILFFYDLQWYLLPNKVIHPLWAVSLAAFAARFWAAPTAHTLLLGLGAVAVGAGFFWLLYVISNGKWIGYGDVRLGLAIGLFLGTPLLAALTIFAASFIGVAAAVPGMLKHTTKLNSKIPFGPLLILGLVLVRLWGQKAIDWYAVHLLFL